MKINLNKSAILATLAVTLIGGFTFSQTELNSIPDTGNVGLGIINPTEKLEVIGSARISKDVTIEGTTSMQSAAVAADLKVEGNIV